MSAIPRETRVREFGLAMTAKLGVLPEDQDRDRDRDEWATSTGWTCTLRLNGDRTMTVSFWMGSGHGGRKPKPTDLLDSLVSEAYAGAEAFDDFCAELGYDTDSRKAYAAWEACRHIRVRLIELLGGEDRLRQLSYILNDEGP